MQKVMNEQVFLPGNVSPIEMEKFKKELTCMKIRPYISDKDFKYISKWIDSEKEHLFWCANRFPYPVTQESLHDLLEERTADQKKSAYVATDHNGKAVGFFCYFASVKDNIGSLKFVIIAREQRRQGYGTEMLNLALQYAFRVTGVKEVQLNVFAENAIAKRSYERAGFTEQHIEKNVFPYKGECWSRCKMAISREQFESLEKI